MNKREAEKEVAKEIVQEEPTTRIYLTTEEIQMVLDLLPAVSVRGPKSAKTLYDLNEKLSGAMVVAVLREQKEAKEEENNAEAVENELREKESDIMEKEGE